MRSGTQLTALMFLVSLWACTPTTEEILLTVGVSVATDAQVAPVPSGCSNKFRDGTETGIDCGGLCKPCGIHQKCLVNSDCASEASCISKHCVYPYLEDADTTRVRPAVGVPPLIAELANLPYPRISQTENATLTAPDVFSKYDLISTKPYTFQRIKSLKEAFPSVAYLRYISPRAYQGHNETYGKQGSGMPFWSTNTATIPTDAARYSMFAGHWMYSAGTRTITPISEIGTSITVTVENAAVIDVGSYVVVYDDEPVPAKLFRNAEHIRVMAKSGNELTLDRTTLVVDGVNKSQALPHSPNSIIAMHHLGAGTSAQLWAYNVSLDCPRDANNKTLAEVFAGWLIENYGRDSLGTQASFSVEGLMFDADLYYEFGPIDANNDLLTDMGIDAEGTNTFGKGMQHFYSLLRASPQLANKLIVGGSTNARTDVALNGTQMESMPADSPLVINPTYDKFDTSFARLTQHMHHPAVAPAYSEVFIRLPTKTYPNQEGSVGLSDAPFRFALGVALLEGAFFCLENSPHALDPWFDEYAVDVIPNSSTFGQAIPLSAGNATIRSHKGWMGLPTGPRGRVYSPAFAPSQSLFAQYGLNGSFESDLSGWSGTNVVLTRDPNTQMDGVASLSVSKQVVYSPATDGAIIQAPSFPVEANTEYTVAFSVRSDVSREIRVSFGLADNRFVPVGLKWKRAIVTFKSGAAGDFAFNFQVGRENSPVWLDSVYVFKGNANVFIRRFEHAVVAVNATRTPQTIPFWKPLQRISGAQNPDVNTGAIESKSLIPPYDSVIFVKP